MSTQNGWLSIDRVRVELMRIAHSDDDAFLNTLDPRVLLGWYVVFVSVPWMFYDTLVLGALLAFMGVLVVVSRVNRILLAVLVFGMVSNLAFFGVVVWATGGDAVGAVRALVPYNLKLASISLASVAVFTTMTPSRLSKGLLSLGVPRKFTFSLAYGYRMLPVLLEEYRDIVHAIRLRSRGPARDGVLRWRHWWHLLWIGVRAFYPLIFDVAKRSRVTVEAMETRGFSRSLGDPSSRRLRFETLGTGTRDWAFLGLSAVFLLGLFWLRATTFLPGLR
ncbi:energy-coupling factor transporter transmembrane component T family protein [Halorhabdus amylolytica]|uniref:energy-coupling factor transporter transmembrane component T family protein n=1 Tax=Halorhabdus amylolytica TaxID=2559573 RepID=UPI0010AB403D|nr:energy-coupling factor transporter transmembrane component T [Halorhabdus amylolytica]